MVEIINCTRYFETPMERHFYINKFLIHNKNVVGIKTGREEEGYFVKYQEKIIKN